MEIGDFETGAVADSNPDDEPQGRNPVGNFEERGSQALSPGAALSAVLFSAGSTVEFSRLREFFGWSDKELGLAADSAKKSLAAAGLTIIEVASGLKMVTLPDVFAVIDGFFQRIKQTGLSKAALEAVSIIAYRQPCTRTDVEEIRGVNCEGVIKGLLDKRLIKVKERTEGPGRPFSYITTDRFLEIFGLKTIKDLPKVNSRLG